MSDNLRKRALMSGLPPIRPVTSSRSASNNSNGLQKKRDYTPLPWNEYFERKHDVLVDDDKFCVYESGTEGPVCFFLHGGGFSGLSWALLSKMLTKMLPCRCAAMDSRGHGNTVTSDDMLLSAEVQARDVGHVVQKLYGEEGPSIVLIGHSMGGAIAIHSVVGEMVPTVAGLIVIDVVEGTALEALTSMQSFLRSRPSTFRSVEHAIEYCVRSGQIRNLESARVSVIGQIKRVENEVGPSAGETKTSTAAAASPVIAATGHSLKVSLLSDKNVIKEDEEANGTPSDDDIDDDSTSNGNHQNGVSSDSNGTHNGSNGHHITEDTDVNKSADINKESTTGGYAWRIDLTKTEKYWEGWFQGMSKMFLSCGVPKMLLLAGIDRLDRELTVGQMQGKFQMQVLPKCGHAVHEDSPDKVTDVIASFLIRNRLVEPPENFDRRLLAV